MALRTIVRILLSTVIQRLTHIFRRLHLPEHRVWSSDHWALRQLRSHCGIGQGVLRHSDEGDEQEDRPVLCCQDDPGE